MPRGALGIITSECVQVEVENFSDRMREVPHKETLMSRHLTLRLELNPSK